MTRRFEIVTRSEAITRGLKRYFTGEPCRRGHVTERTVSSRACIICSRENLQRNRIENPERTRESNRNNSERRRKVDPEGARASVRKWAEKYPERKRASDAASYARNREGRKAKVKAYAERNRDKVLADGRIRRKEWDSANPGRRRERVARRRAAKLQATPNWLTPGDHAAIAAHYAEAISLEEQTGEPHHVDHIVPLQGKRVCGLHVPWNLRAMPAADNLSKGNRHELP